MNDLGGVENHYLALNFFFNFENKSQILYQQRKNIFIKLNYVFYLYI
jgi:hypothetical protein